MLSIQNSQTTEKNVTTKITKALRQAILETDKIEAAISSNTTCVISKDGLFRVYLYENKNGQYCAAGYIKRSKKADFRYRFKDYHDRENYTDKWLIEKAKKEMEAKEINKRSLEAGDILYSQWGYEQTNIDFYLVTRLIGKTMVEIVQIGASENYTEYLSGDCIPDTDNVIGLPMKKIAKGNWVRVCDVITATRLDYKEVDGVRVYQKKYFSRTY